LNLSQIERIQLLLDRSRSRNVGAAGPFPHADGPSAQRGIVFLRDPAASSSPLMENAVLRMPAAILLTAALCLGEAASRSAPPRAPIRTAQSPDRASDFPSRR